jgi:hypothetical protein
MYLMADVLLNKLLWKEDEEIPYSASCLILNQKSTHTMFGGYTPLLRYPLLFALLHFQCYPLYVLAVEDLYILSVQIPIPSSTWCDSKAGGMCYLWVPTDH